MKFKSSNYIILIITLSSFKLFAQEITTRDRFRYNIQKAVNVIKIDGVESENEWNNTQLIDTLYNHNPVDTGLSKNSSEIRLAFDDEYLYIFAKHYDKGRRIIQSLQRDSDNSQWGSDSFTIAIDPINKKQGGIMIGINAGGAELDGTLLVEPSRTTYSAAWDERWFSSTKQYHNYWLTEIAIPFTSLRYNQDNLEWGINFIRGDKVEGYYTAWTTPFPINFNGIDVNYMGTLVWPKVPKVKNKIAFIKPYATLSSLKDNLSEDTEVDSKIDAGVDVKMAITKSLSTDITFNPDFSNAEVDQEVTNITRFNISLPEQREFFVENADIFSNFGSYEIEPFFSRRIGLNTPITYGARVTGNITDNLRIGAMNVQTKEEGNFDAQNNTIAAFNYKVLDRSQFRGLFVNRQETGNDAVNDYARNYGAEFTYISKKGNFSNSIKYHGSTDDEGTKGNYFGVSGEYTNRNLRTGWNFDVLDKNYQADIGFTPRLFNFDADNETVVRKGYIFINPYILYRFFPKKKSSKLNFQRLRTWHNFFLNSNGSLNERQNNFAYDLGFKNTSEFTIQGTNREVNLNFATNFLGSKYENLPAQNYNFTSVTARYTSDRRNQFAYAVAATYGEFFNGNIATLKTTGNVRFGYWGNFSLSYDFNNISLLENYGNLDLHLFRFRGSVSVTNKLFINNVVQYNSQSENFSVFSRLQWRYSPLSDIFLIYNQNNNTTNFDLDNRSIILKLTYRFAV